MADNVKPATDEQRESLFGPHGVLGTGFVSGNVRMWARALDVRIDAEKARVEEAEKKATSAWNMWHEACHDIGKLKAELEMEKDRNKQVEKEASDYLDRINPLQSEVERLEAENAELRKERTEWRAATGLGHLTPSEAGAQIDREDERRVELEEELSQIDAALDAVTKCQAATRAERIIDSFKHNELVTDYIVFDATKAEQSARAQCVYWMGMLHEAKRQIDTLRAEKAELERAQAEDEMRKETLVISEYQSEMVEAFCQALIREKGPDSVLDYELHQKMDGSRVRWWFERKKEE